MGLVIISMMVLYNANVIIKYNERSGLPNAPLRHSTETRHHQYRKT